MLVDVWTKKKLAPVTPFAFSLKKTYRKAIEIIIHFRLQKPILRAELMQINFNECFFCSR